MGMIRMVLGITIGMLAHFHYCAGQDLSREQRIASDSSYQLYQFVVDMPVGQSFINQGHCHSYHSVKFHFPDENTTTKVESESLGKVLRTHIMMMGGNTASYVHEENGPGGKTVVMRGSYTVGGDPSEYVADLRPALNQPLDLRMHLGHGGTRLDLSDLRTRKVLIESSAADVFVSYNKPNLERMQLMRINTGMGEVFLRNVENARADKISIDNGMGNTKVIVGEESYGATWMELGVGTGTCLMMVHQNAPIKIVLKGTFFSSVEIPDEFMQTGDDTYVNLAFKKNPNKALTVVVDPGLGSYTLVNYK